jgi:deoxyribodipyrimidine photolyase-related protein
VAAVPGDGGFARWRGRAVVATQVADGVDGGACPSVLGAVAPVPPAFWGAESGLACLDRVVADVWREGWSHHITRLMVLSNIATLLGISPRELSDWFWVAYIDAFDWVVEPNVLGMGTYGVGGLMTTKPYVSGGAYIHRMSNYCGGCRFDPARNCPVTALYWDFMARHEALLRKNVRTSGAIAGLSRRTDTQRARDHQVAERVRARFQAGEVVEREDVKI